MKLSKIILFFEITIKFCFFLISWIMNYFYLADKDGSGTLSKKECHHLLTHSLNAKVPYHIFEQLFKVKFFFFLLHMILIVFFSSVCVF
jgi:hypothetical protein